MRNLVIKLAFFGMLVGLSSAANCGEITIDSPNNGEKVGARVIVEGKSSLEDGDNVWILAHLKLLQGQWWPQPKPVVDQNGNWQALIYLGGPQDVGQEFEIAVAAFSNEEEAKIVKYHETGRKTGKWLPISFPKTTSKVKIVTVKKTNH